MFGDVTDGHGSAARSWIRGAATCGRVLLVGGLVGCSGGEGATPPKVSKQPLQIVPTSITLAPYEGGGRLIATWPASVQAPLRIDWVSGNTAIAYAGAATGTRGDTGIVSAHAVGTTTVTAVPDTSSLLTSTSVAVTVSASWPTRWIRENRGFGANFTGIFARSPTEIYATATTSPTLRFDGTQWSVVGNVNPNGWMVGTDVWASAPNDVWVVGPYGQSYRYIGSVWTSFSLGNGGDLHGIWGASAGDVYVVGDSGVIGHYNGTALVREQSPTSKRLRDVWGSGPNDVWAVGDEGVIVHRDASGWRLVPLPSTVTSPPYFEGVWGSSASNVYAVGRGFMPMNGGDIWQYDGSTWRQVLNLGPSPLHSVWGTGPDDVYAVGGLPQSGLRIVLHFGGQEWRRVQLPLQVSESYYAVGGSGRLDIIIAGYGGIWRGTP